MPEKYDDLIIGSGQAGPFLAARLAAAGRRVAIVERKWFGGTCVNNGCIPTKTMVASAYAARMAQRAAEYGVTIPGSITVDMQRVKARKDAIVLKDREGLESWLAGTPNITIYHGAARFVASHEVAVGDARLTADRIFINVGGRAAVPDLPDIRDVPFLTNSSMMDIDFVPRHLVVVGGSYIGLEFGQMFRRFGSEVTIVEMGPRLIGREDEDISAAILDIIQAEGIHVRLNAKCITLAPHTDGIGVGVDCQDGPPEIIGSHVLLAVGRRPNTSDLGLEAAGIHTDARGYIVANDRLETNVPGVWALGDCNGKAAFTHTSYNEFEIVAANLLDGESRSVNDRIMAYALYIDPPLGRAGSTEAEVSKSGRQALIATRPMTRVGRAIEKGETQGFMKILVDAETKLILGAAILGTAGDEVIHCILDTMYARAPYTTLRRAMHIHPTVSELIPTLLGDLKPLT